MSKSKKQTQEKSNKDLKVSITEFLKIGGLLELSYGKTVALLSTSIGRQRAMTQLKKKKIFSPECEDIFVKLNARPQVN